MCVLGGGGNKVEEEGVCGKECVGGGVFIMRVE